MRGKKHFHKLTIEDVHAKTAKKMEEEAKAALNSVNNKIQTVLVPIEKSMNSRSRGYSNVNPLDFLDPQNARTRSSGHSSMFQPRSKPELIAFEGDLLSGHKIVKEGEVIETSNRHIIHRLITELRGKLGRNSSQNVDDQRVNIHQADGAQGQG